MYNINPIYFQSASEIYFLDSRKTKLLSCIFFLGTNHSGGNSGGTSHTSNMFSQLKQTWYRLKNVSNIALSPSFTSDFHVTFHVIWFLNTNGGVTKNYWLQNVGNFVGNHLYGVYFSKVTSLQCIDCNSIIKRPHHSLCWTNL